MSGTVTQWLQAAKRVGLWLQPGWDDYMASLSAGPQGQTNPPTMRQMRGALWANDFDVGDEMFVTIHVQHDWKPGTDMYPHIHWVTNDASPTGNAVWQIDYSVAKRNDTTPEAFPAESTITLTAPMTTQYGHVVTEATDLQVIPGTDIEVDCLIMFRISRLTDGGAGGDAKNLFGLQLDLHYQKSHFSTPNRAPDFYG